MYAASSPIFDAPDLPALRRTKPLPKRRRTSLSASNDDAHSEDSLPDTEEAHVQPDSLSVQLALQSYYMPILGGVHDLLKHNPDNGPPSSLDLNGTSETGTRNGREQADDEEGDYIEHLQQPGNTKKRKVPANLGAMGPGHELGSAQSVSDEEPTDRAIPTGRPEHEYDLVASLPPENAARGPVVPRRGKLSRATLAGLQHKEMLKSRKRQLAAVLGALTHGDTLALDQALSANYPFASNSVISDLQKQNLVKVRLSKSRASRLARAYKAFRSTLPSTRPSTFPQSDFTFTCHSATSDRLIATKEEVLALHSKFEVELSRQAAKAAEAAKQTAAVLNGGRSAKRKAKQGRTTAGRTSDLKVDSPENSLLGAPPPKGKKKKRSALANASNPHHLRNYVPSRLPHSGQANATSLNAQNLLSPLPTRFLSADIPPRRRKKSTPPISSISNPIEEWICPFCEYELFYGSDEDYRRALSNRKKILKRRRRARERAAAAASGAAAALARSTTSSEDVDAEFEAHYDVPETLHGAGTGKQTRGGSWWG
ncbi:hypothetical protein EW026_g1924 [Hermanssonia centrifuga]|uniref:Uncharacterized protein n=1 Tax=Hermanssonia centrifuga TaxID=98765 RepID=A0A4V3XB50_9APHY|nr:hypothetical protein EW026_g1924 [Hermanssonia centrifuga]